MEFFQSVCLYETEFYEKRMGILNYLTRQMLTTILRVFQLPRTKKSAQFLLFPLPMLLLYSTNDL